MNTPVETHLDSVLREHAVTKQALDQQIVELQAAVADSREGTPRSTWQTGAAGDPCGTFRDTGNVTNLPEDRPEAHVNRYFIKWAPSFDRDEANPWVALNHEADLQLMPNDLMDRYPVIEAAEVQRRLAIGGEAA